ncbi:MAG: hypothetical protein ACXWPM_12615 [Bdellovibrionota bacterium]
MQRLILLPLLIQGTAIAVDEFHFHHKRDLPRWERIGHPLDTASVLACVVWILVHPSGAASRAVFLILAFFSCVLVTKDEAVHASLCGAGEQWLHSVLFLAHPASLGALYFAWQSPSLGWLVTGQSLFLSVFLVYQITYWNFVRLPYAAEAQSHEIRD